MTRDLKYLILGVGFLATILVFSTAVAGAIIALPALAQISGGDDDGRSSFIVDGGSARGNTSTTITDAQMHLAQAMTALQNKNTTGATMQLNLLNQSLSTLSTGAGGMTTSASIPGLGPSGGPATDGSRGPPGDRPSHSSIYGPPGSSTRPPGDRPSHSSIYGPPGSSTRPPGDSPSHSSIYGPPGSSTRPPGGRP
jgi:hypothetical protein